MRISARKIVIIIGSIGVTVVLHLIHSEYMQILLDSGTFVGVVMLALEDEK